METMEGNRTSQNTDSTRNYLNLAVSSQLLAYIAILWRLSIWAIGRKKLIGKSFNEANYGCFVIEVTNIAAP